MMIRAIAVIAAMVLVGCGSGGGGSVAPEEKLPVSVRYVNGDPAKTAAGFSSLRAEEEESAIPMLFYAVRLRAYQYGQRGVMVGSHKDATWSSWDIIDLDDNSDFLLWNGGVAELTPSFREFEAQPDYVDQVGTFSFDFVITEGMPDLINANNSVCGGHNSGAHDVRATQYPELKFGACQHKDVYGDDGWRIIYLRAIFTRNDWFDKQMQIYPASRPNDPDDWGMVCFSASDPLSQFQAEVLTGLLNREIPAEVLAAGGMEYDAECLNNTGRTHEDLRAPVDIPFTLIPMAGDLAVAQLAQDAIPQPPVLTEDGQEIPQPDRIVTSSTLRADVSFRVTPSMVVNYTEFNVDEDTSDIILKPGPNGAPFGMELRFVDDQPAP